MPTPKNNADAVQMQLEKLTRLLHSKNGQTIAQLFAEAQADEKAQSVFEDNFLTPLIDAIEFSIQQGQEEQEFTDRVDAKTLVDMLCGPIFFRVMAHPDDFDEAFIRNYPNEAVKMISA